MKTKHDYYVIYVPPDVSPDDPVDRALIALTQAEDLPRLHCTPCKWDIIKDTGQDVTVRRTRLVNEPGYTERRIMFNSNEPFAFKEQPK